ncbi:uncharacterized protein BDZ99DRAFT_477342 [Mytilinidion resinicola]|uniref:Uncharacterized protein n=1 Tax=Mytilinidion resinicola TaxID=574789 RepID=A0A6A6YJ04_9PEZI|nr:uncharacterized protein BDZ99DRAFT_477342 [Mytilinidion resinicola]KAF2808832.1 hypothetical protein BDZ99DRAFT_477342 [Mytilinidion resinicola]
MARSPYGASPLALLVSSITSPRSTVITRTISGVAKRPVGKTRSFEPLSWTVGRYSDPVSGTPLLSKPKLHTARFSRHLNPKPTLLSFAASSHLIRRMSVATGLIADAAILAGAHTDEGAASFWGPRGPLNTTRMSASLFKV